MPTQPNPQYLSIAGTDSLSRRTSFLKAKGARMMVSPRQLYSFYRDGFRSMVLGRTLWKLIALKLFLMFAVLKLFFFQNFLEKTFHTEAERSAHVLDNLTRNEARR